MKVSSVSFSSILDPDLIIYSVPLICECASEVKSFVRWSPFI